ncbi:MAG TPA: GYF domain-containing protein [Polyangium sp.]|nr:GYF domain-containing protein [Polyangium sp.]
MRAFKMLAERAVGSADRWYVSDGATAVGPVGLELIARGIQEGKVPLESYVRHEAWRVWRPVWEVTELNTTKPADSAAPTPPYQQPHHSQPFRPPESFTPTDDITLPGRPLLPEEIAPADALEGAADISDALHLLLNAAVLHLRADAALLHRVDDGGAIVHFAHGPFARTMIGFETDASDPVIDAAHMGRVVLAEPTPGPAGQALIDRLLHVGVHCDSATMHPILIAGRLIAALEVGRKGLQLRASELVVLEQLVDAFVSRTEAGVWH